MTSGVLVKRVGEPFVLAAGIPGPPGPPGPAGGGGGGETNPAFTYTVGLLSRVDYADGTYKLFVYAVGRLLHVDFVTPTATVRKAFFYNPDGSLHHITEASL